MGFLSISTVIVATQPTQLTHHSWTSLTVFYCRMNGHLKSTGKFNCYFQKHGCYRTLMASYGL